MAVRALHSHVLDVMEARRVLIVDDDRDLGEVLVEVLQSEGFGAQLVTTAEQALAAIAARAPGVVLLDWNLGGDAPETIAESLRARAVPIILSSGDEHADEAAERIGASAVLHKPFSLESLLGLVSQILPKGAAHPPSYS